MYRLLVRFFIFAVGISLSLYIGVQWKLKQDLDDIDKQLGSSIKFRYVSSAIGLNGQVMLGGVEFTLSNPKITVSINKLKFSTGSIFDMAFLSSLLDKRVLPERFNLELDQVVVPLTPELVKLLAQIEQPDTWSMLAAVGCGKVRSIGMTQYFAMGYDYLVFSSETNYSRDSYNGNVIGQSSFRIEETSDVNLQFNFANVFESFDQRAVRPIEPSIESMDIEIIDRGYNRRKNEYCSLKSGQPVDVYLAQHIKQVKQKFDQVGIKLTPTGTRFYTEYLKPSSQLALSVSPKASFSTADFGFYDESELRDILGLEMKLNGNNVGVIFNGWSHDKFSQIQFDKREENQAGQDNKRFQNVIIRRTFQQVPVSQLGQNIGEQARITQADGKQLVGKLIKIENQRVYLATPREGGTVQRSVPVSQVSQLEILVRTQ
jgi:hypothetical protein